MKYDFFGQEWHGVCGACKEELYAPSKGAWLVQFNMHTHSSNCLGGW